MIRLAILALCFALLTAPVSARFIKVYPSPRTGATKQKRALKKKVRRHKRRTVPKVQKTGVRDWDSVMRENQPRTDAQMMPEEYGQWLKNLSNQELDLYLKFRLTDAIPFTIVEAEAKKRGIR